MKRPALAFLLLAGLGFVPAPSVVAQPPPPTASTAVAPAPAFRHPPGDFVTVNGAKLWYESIGSGEPMLLIAGGPGYSHSYLHPQFDALTTSHRVIFFDAFGRGKSDRAKSPTEYTFDRDVRDVVGLCEALKLGPVSLLGHSYGGVVAQAMALTYPAAVKKLVLVDTFHSAEMWQAGNDHYNNETRLLFPETWAQFQQLRARGLRSSAPECYALTAKVPVWLGTHYFDGSNDAKAEALFELEPAVYFTIAGDDADFLLGSDLARLDFRSELKNLKMPVLILTGRFDGGAMPHYALQYRQYAPQAEFVMFERSGHLPFLEEQEKALAILRAFLAR